MNKEIQSEKIWMHLEKMYNLEALDESESLPFPNDKKDFFLPDSEFSLLKVKKHEKNEEKKNSLKGRETPKMKEMKKEDKTPARGTNGNKEMQRRDSRDSKDGKPISAKKEIKKEPELKNNKQVKGRASMNNKEENKLKNKSEDTPRTTKRPTRGSLKPDDGSNGKGSPLTVTPATKRRRL